MVKHYWALMEGELVVLIKVENGNFYAAGDWEEPISKEQLEILEEIPVPMEYETYPFYYRANMG